MATVEEIYQSLHPRSRYSPSYPELRAELDKIDGADPGMQMIAVEVQRVAAGVDVLARIQERTNRCLIKILEMNTELLDRYITETRVAELKASKWEAEARRLREQQRQD